MKYIAGIAVIAIVLLQASGAVPKSSDGGAMTLALVVFAATIATGMYEAYENKRSVFGWIVSIAIAIAGTLLAAEAAELLMVAIVPLLRLSGSIADLQPVALYLASAAIMLFFLLGAWLALRFASRWR